MAHYKFHNDCQSSVLTYEQVKRLDYVMDQVVPIHGRGSFPTLYVKLKELIRLVKHKLQKEHSIEIRDVRLNGSLASYVLAPENSHYNDLDLIFGTDLSNEHQFDVIRDVVLECLQEFYNNATATQQQQLQLQNATNNNNDSENESQDTTRHSLPFQMPPSNCCAMMKEAYVHKMVKVNDDDRWSLISLGVQQSETNCCAATAAAIGCNNTQSNHQSNTCTPQQQQQHQLQQFAEINRPENRQKNQPQQQRDNTGTGVEDDGARYASSGCFVSSDQQLSNNYHHSHSHQQQHHQHHNNHHSHHHQQQRQFPNSIELKFVGRMRRKFEFSVDSFQIILDSLLQFYDYAPQSTITLQKKCTNSASPGAANNPCQGGNVRRRCSLCCPTTRTIVIDDSENLSLVIASSSAAATKTNDNNGPKKLTMRRRSFDSQNQQRKTSMHAFSRTNSPESSLNNSKDACCYQLPASSDSPLAASSEASSSGCSSSSSVVSSSSSSCDGDHEDFFCEVDGPSSSSASTSSLISSGASSIMSGSCGEAIQSRKSDKHHHHHNHQQHNHQLHHHHHNQHNHNNHHQNNLRNKQIGIGQTAASAANSLSGSQRSMKRASDFGTDRGTRSNNCDVCLGFKASIDGHGLCLKDRLSCAVISENFYPTVIGRSEYGNFKDALYHLEKKLIATKSPEEIRGGGLLKYCNLLVKNYKPTNVYQLRTLERYMCSRFFIDFSDLNQQRAKLESYLANHFSDDPILKFDYLTILHSVVQRSTVCLMTHELRLTLNMIKDLAYKLTTVMEGKATTNYVNLH